MQSNKLIDRPVCLTAGLYDSTAVLVADVVAWLIALRPTDGAVMLTTAIMTCPYWRVDVQHSTVLSAEQISIAVSVQVQFTKQSGLQNVETEGFHVDPAEQLVSERHSDWLRQRHSEGQVSR